MTSTEQLIASLTQEAKPVSPLPAPGRLAVRLALILMFYVLITSYVLELRPDLALQLTRPLYLIELALLSLLAASSLTTTVYRAFPDLYQHPAVTRWPGWLLAGFVLLLILEAFIPLGEVAVIATGPEVHTLECTLCIAALTILPAAGAMRLLAKGAPTQPAIAGVYAVLAAAATGCLVLRLIEANDDPLHLMIWHYLPTLGFAILGGIIGKTILKW